MARKRWTYSAGSRPHTVTVYERGGRLHARAWDATLGSNGGWRRRSLGHNDRDRAKAYALEQAAKLRKGTAEITAGVVKLAQVIDLYLLHRTPRKGLSEQGQDKRRADLWKRFLGGDTDPHTITLASWERFIDLRTSGAIDSHARPVQTEDRRIVRTESTSQDLQWLGWLLNWASKWRTPQGHYLLRENAVRGYDVPVEKEPTAARGH